MLKRLSATLAPNSSSSSSSISPSHSSASSLDRNIPTSSTASTYHHHYASHHSSSLNTPSIHDINTYPRPSGMSTPYSSSAPDLSPGLGYFGVLPSSSASSNGGGLSPSLNSTSRNVSPAQSPRLEMRSLPSTSNADIPNYASSTPPVPIDRPTLQKSLRCLETLLVTMDEYRELSVRTAKVEKRLAKAGRELASSMTEEKGSGNSKGKDRGPYAILQALHTTSNLFESLSDVSTKFSRHLSKEYDLINDLIGKSFKKIAKEERIQDDLIESLDSKLKKANYTYDKKIRSSVPGGGIGGPSSNAPNTVQNVHEQFVPILSSLTEDIKKTKYNHGINMFIKRGEIVKETSKTLTCLSEIEFRKNCELVKKLGGYIGNILAIQALLGPSPSGGSSNSANGNGANAGRGEMPNHWPPELQDPDEFGRVATEQQGKRAEGMQEFQGHVHPLASTRPSSSEDLAISEEQQYHNVTGGRSLDDLLPPRAPFTLHPTQSGHDRIRKGSDASMSSSNDQRSLPPPTNRSYSNISNGSSTTTTTSRSISLNQLADHALSGHGTNRISNEKYGSISAGRGVEGGNGNNAGQRSVSFPVEQMTRPSSAAMDHDATVTMRNIHSKPTVDTSFFPSSNSSVESPRNPASRRGTGDFENGMPREGSRDITSKEPSPTLKSQTGARTPALQPALSYSPSQSGRVGYFSEKHACQIREESEEADTYARERKDEHDAGNNLENYAKARKMPAGFVVEEHSPEQYLHHHKRQERDHPNSHRSTSSEMRSSPDSATLGDSPTLSLGGTTGANTSSTSYSRNLNESYASPPLHQNSHSKDRESRSGSGEVGKDGKERVSSRLGDKPGAQLERSLSIESTASEQSFVARMKARYVEEKEARRASKQQHQHTSSGNEHMHHTPSTSMSSDARPSGRRVSTIAQKWEEKSLNGGAPTSGMAALGTGRPAHHHQHRASMPVVPSMAASNNHWSTSSVSSSPHHAGSGGSASSKPDMPRYSSAGATTGTKESHPSVCGCEECAREGYASPSREHEIAHRGLTGRRVSLPPGRH